MTTATATNAPVPAINPSQLNLQALERAVATSRMFALAIVFGLPFAGTVTAVCFGLPVFAAFASGFFLFCVSVNIFKAVTTFTGKLLRLLVMARMVFIMGLASLLFVTTGQVWMVLVSAVLLWLVTDRLLGRRALYDLYKAVKSS